MITRSRLLCGRDRALNIFSRRTLTRSDGLHVVGLPFFMMLLYEKTKAALLSGNAARCRVGFLFYAHRWKRGAGTNGARSLY
jgi:hypothetical protein